MNSDCKLKQKTIYLTKMEFDIFIDEKEIYHWIDTYIP